MHCVIREMGLLWWHHNGHDGASNHQPHHCLLNRLFGCRSKKTSKLSVTGLCAGNSSVPGEWPVTRKMFPFDDVIMYLSYLGIVTSWPHPLLLVYSFVVFIILVTWKSQYMIIVVFNPHTFHYELISERGIDKTYLHNGSYKNTSS